jgi:hypothetical protein
MDASYCSSCGLQLEATDNFCRRCGFAAADHAGLPAVRAQATPSIWKPQVSPAVKGAAVMAAGTVGQFLLRKAVNGLVNRPQRTGTINIRQPKQKDGLVDEAQVITETVMMRRVRIRRQPE